MRVYKKMTADEIQKLMFGPIQEAARKAYGDQFEYGELPPEEDDEEEPEPEPLPPPPPPPPTPPKEPERVTGPLEWCDLSELRLTMLVCEFKPVGVNRNFHLQAIMARMHNVFEHEPIQAKMFLAGDDSAVFYEKVKERVVSGKVHDQKKPFASFPPRYGCRPTLEMIEDKLNSWFGMSICEENESYPTGLCEVTDFRLPKAILEASGEEQEGNGKKRGNKAKEENKSDSSSTEEQEKPITSEPNTSEPSTTTASTSEPSTSEPSTSAEKSTAEAQPTPVATESATEPVANDTAQPVAEPVPAPQQ